MKLIASHARPSILNVRQHGKHIIFLETAQGENVLTASNSSSLRPFGLTPAGLGGGCGGGEGGSPRDLSLKLATTFPKNDDVDGLAEAEAEADAADASVAVEVIDTEELMRSAAAKAGRCRCVIVLPPLVFVVLLVACLRSR